MSVAIQIEVFDNKLYPKSFFQAGSGDLLECNFSLSEYGCSNFRLLFSNFVNIDKRDFVKIKLFGSDYMYYGVVRTIPIKGSTNFNYEYTGFGLNDYFLRTNTESLTYTNQTVTEIINDIVDNVLIPKTPITKGTLKIDDININVGSLEFKFVTVKDALEEIVKIANSDGNDYIYGVDSEGDFFFHARDLDVQATLTVGKTGDFGITDYSPQDSYEEKSIIHVLKSDGTYYKTFYSLENIDIYESKVTAPEGLTEDDDLDNWAEGQLKILEQSKRQANIEWQIESSNPYPLIANGTLRIISLLPPTKTVLIENPYGSGVYGSGLYGGEQSDFFILDDTLIIKNVDYKITKDQALRTIQLGELPVSLDREIINVNKNVEELRLSLGR